MKDGWQIKKLGNLATYANGYPFKPSDWSESGRPIIRIQNLNSAKEDFHFFNGSILPRFSVYSGDVLISWSASLGVYIWDGPEAVLNQHIFKVLFDKVPIDKKFFVYAVSYKLDEMKKLVHGVTMQHITKGKFDAIDIPVPSLSEQQRIVDILDAEFDKIDKIRANAEQNLQHAKDLLQATLKEAFHNHASWKWSVIGNVCKTGSGGTPLKLHKEYYEEGTIPWLRSGEVCNKYIDTTEMYITELGMENSSAKWFPENSVLVAMYGATAGQVGILKIRTTTNQAVCGIFPNEKFLPEFLYYSLLKAQKDLVSKATGNAQPNISQIKIRETAVPILSIDEQKKIVANLDEIDAKCRTLQENYTKTIALCDDLKQALLRKAFNGDL